MRRTSGCCVRWKMIFWKPPAYHDSTKRRNVFTPARSGMEKSRSQSTCSPAYLRARQYDASCADLKAMVTPEENTGSRNSPALPSNAYPGPHSDDTLLE